MSDLSEHSLDQLQRKACADPCFTDDEKTLIREMIRVYRGWLFVARVGKGTVVVLGIMAAGIASWGTIGEAIKRWLG
ncbi:hypothetical protein PRZ61_10800 [Halomonas pacifica]|uniref:hypothetical protein n=1 Tax=Bisbaumannia pacifica TaxID=77098 RepID=UPI0023581ED6|nr:hypothetical protein [Halomonas pacifica]MDC8803924.1 hypothetical protein [Halomonas pacifica]